MAKYLKGTYCFLNNEYVDIPFFYFFLVAIEWSNYFQCLYVIQLSDKYCSTS